MCHMNLHDKIEIYVEMLAAYMHMCRMCISQNRNVYRNACSVYALVSYVCVIV